MFRTLVSTQNLSRDEWVKWRNKGIGGSDASIVCGVNKYKSPVELWMEKTGVIEPSEPGEAAYWGTVMEPIIRDEFSKATGLEVKIEKSILQHPGIDFMLANVDGIIEHPDYGWCIFEAKTASSYRADEWENSIPEEYQLQVQHYMAVTGFNAAFVAVLIGGNTFKWKLVERDDELIEMLIILEESFWTCVTTNTPPPMDGSEASSELLNRLYPRSNSQSSITLPEDALDLIRQYEQASEQEKKFNELKNEASNKLKSMLGTNEAATVGERIVSWKTISTERFDTKLLASELPEIFSKYTVKSHYRRMTIK